MGMSQQMWAAGLDESNRRFLNQYNSRANAQKYGTDNPDGRRPSPRLSVHEGRLMTARYNGICALCSGRIEVGTQIEYTPSTRTVSHAVCPPKAANTETGLIAQRADDLLNEYDTLKANQERIAATIRKPVAATMTRKAIYRVSLTGGRQKYGTDVVNVALTPNEKYGSIKVAEYRGESIGVVKADGSFMYWNTVDQNDTRVAAIRAAADVILNAADPISYAKAFATESSQCMRCGDDLVDETSMARLLGPTCFKKWDA